MSAVLSTEAEKRADAASKLPAFKINLGAIKAGVESILKEWRTSGFFREYTDHSIDHVDGMLVDLEWIIPDETKQIMTPADWLLIVLSVYFHDVGLLITKDEFAKRHSNTAFQQFKDDPLVEARQFSDYKAAINALTLEEADRIYYEEFVRSTHGARIKAWLKGEGGNTLGLSHAVTEILYPLLVGLEATFLNDLGNVCESHTGDDLENRVRFPVSQPYGGPAETANVFYAALVLRTVDLLNITRARAPSIAYQLINPSDPTSQLEWQKQNRVRSVRSQTKKNSEGAADPAIQPDTVEVFAKFDEPEPFFGLTSYLAYSQKQLVASQSMCEKAQKETISPYKFPWRYIDQTKIETEGFLTQSFEFELDQHKILDLLTGHTLYNNSNVVLRELTQNALDAVRLQAYQNKKDPCEHGEIIISWNSSSRILSVQDNGTGMTQEIVEKHLLKVGSSRYQDKKFRESHPNFHSISRFGIGVLSAFMVSDDVEILTCAVDETEARQISLRSVHGKYLIKTLDKGRDRDAISVFPHGTKVSLKVRHSSDVGDVLALARRWLLFPRSKVVVIIDEESPVAIGYSSPKEALQSFLESGSFRHGFRRDFAIKEREVDGVQLAFVVEKSEIYRDWSFSQVPSFSTRAGSAPDVGPPVAVCIEGVAVEEASPGFRGVSLLAIVNATGSLAPKTNVARSALEDTPELRALLNSIYGMYADHVRDEVARLQTEERFSLTRAIGHARIVAAPLTSGNLVPGKSESLSKSLDSIPFFVVESDNGRAPATVDEMLPRDSFLTVESPLRRSMETLVKEAPADITTRQLIEVLGNQPDVPAGSSVVCNFQTYSHADRRLQENFEISHVDASLDDRRLKITWSPTGNPQRWFYLSRFLDDMIRSDRSFFSAVTEARDRMRGGRELGDLYVPINGVTTSGLEGYGRFMSRGQIFLLPNSPIVDYIGGLTRESEFSRHVYAANVLLLSTIHHYGVSYENVTEDVVTRATSNVLLSDINQYLGGLPEFVAALRGTSSRMFEPFAWDKRDGGRWEM